MELIQAAFKEGQLSEESTCQALVIILKGGGGYHSIGLTEVVWKVFMLVLNFRLTTSISLYDFFHCFQAGRGTGTISLEAKLVHQLTAIREESYV